MDMLTYLLNYQSHLRFLSIRMTKRISLHG